VTEKYKSRWHVMKRSGNRVERVRGVAKDKERNGSGDQRVCTRPMSLGTTFWHSILAAELNSETGESGEDIANLGSGTGCGEVAGTAVHACAVLLRLE
jgi:hypothetical protein